jgi:hypothetical protein
VESVSHLLFRKRQSPDFERALGGARPAPAGAAFIYHNANVLPRARLLGRPIYVASEADAAAAIDRIGPEIRTRLIVEDASRPLAEDAVASGSARVERDEPERVEVAAACDGPCYLMLADTFDPGWSATVDGRPAPIRPADAAFRAVYLAAGEHRVVFTYRPAGFAAGLAVTAAGAAAALALLIWPRRLRTLRPAHDALGWPARWPARLWLALAAVAAASAISIGPTGRPRLHPRWDHSLHPFTWGAGIEAMRTTPPPA